MEMRIGAMTRGLLAAGVISCAGTIPLSASALMLGEIAAHSYLGQVFRATIPLTPGAGEELDSRCFTLIRPARQEGGVYLNQAHLSLEQKKGQQYLSIRSTNAINEPFVQLLLQADCGQGRLEREFVVLLDPEERAALQAPAVTQDMIREAPAEPPPEPARASRRTRIAPPASPSVPKSAGVADPSRQRSASASSGAVRRSGSEPPVATRTVEPGEFRLRLSSSEDLDLSMLGKLSEAQRQQLREKQRLLDADDQVANTLSMKNRIMQLESQLDQLQAELAKTNNRLASSSRQAPVPVPVPVPPSPPLTDRLLAGGENISFRGMAGVGLILALLLSVWWRWRRRQAETWLDAELSQEFPANEACRTPVVQQGAQTAAAPVPSTTQAAPAVAGNGKDDDFYHSATSIFDAENESVTFTEAESILDEADLYLAYGWANRAIELLQEYLEKHPEDTLLWKKLFETYSSQGMKQEFEQLALRCQATQDNSGLWVLVQKLGRQLDEENPLYLASPEQQPEEPVGNAVPEPEVPTLDTPLEFVLDDRGPDTVKQEEPASEEGSLELDPLFPEPLDDKKKGSENPESTAGR